MKKIKIIALSVSTGALALSAPVLACDMHGAGYSGGAFGMNWQSYTPRVSTMDPALSEVLAEEVYERDDYTSLPKASPKRPSFSSAANRASQKALMKRAHAQSDDKSDKTASDKPAVQKASLDSDR